MLVRRRLRVSRPREERFGLAGEIAGSRRPRASSAPSSRFVPRAPSPPRGANDRLLVSGPDGELASVRAPAAGLGDGRRHAARVVATKTDVALVAMAVSPSDGDATTTRIVAVGADWTLRAYDIPDASDAGMAPRGVARGVAPARSDIMAENRRRRGVGDQRERRRVGDGGRRTERVVDVGRRARRGRRRDARAQRSTTPSSAARTPSSSVRDGKLASRGGGRLPFSSSSLRAFAPVAVSTTTPTTMKTATMSVDVVPDVPDDAEEPTVASSGAVAGGGGG